MLKLKGRNVCERGLQFSLRKCRQFGKALRLSIKTLVTTDGFSGDAETLDAVFTQPRFLSRPGSLRFFRHSSLLPY
jgi:hypothetical protein